MSSKAKDTGFLRNLVKYDSSGNITLPAALSIFTNKEVATKEYVDSRFTSIINDAPAILDTLSELATAIGNDGNFATTITSSINTKANKSTTITINGTAYDLSANRSWTIDSMVYPAAGIALSTGTGWGTSITNNSTNWNTAYGWGNHASAGYEVSSNKSNNPSLGTSDTLYPTQSAVKSYVDSAVTGGVNIQGDWNASTNTPNISTTTTTGFTWRVSVAGTTNLGGITVWNVNDLAVKTASGWIKIDNSSSVTSVFGRQGVVVANSGDYNTSQVTESGNLYFTNARARAAFSAGANITIDVNGVIASTYSYTLPVATSTVLGGVKIGSGVTITNGVISVSTNYEAPITAGTTAQYWRGDKTWQTLPTYTLPIASGTVLGGIKVGTNLSIDVNGVLSSTDTNTWNANSKDVAGYVAAPGAIANKVWKTDGAGNPAWRDDADTVYSLPTATASILGGVKIGAGVTITSGVISVSTNYESPISAGTTGQYWRGDKSWQPLNSTAVGLGNVSNAAQVTTTYNTSLNSDSRNSRGVTRLYRRDDDSDYSVQTYWTGTYWRLYGYNGDTAHADVQVGYSDSADYATNGRYVYDNGTYGGSVQWKEASAMYVAYARNSRNAEYADIGFYVRNYNSVGSTNGTMTFYWAGQSGQPTWLWGSNNGTDIYVWNPSNFSVNYANSAGYAATAGSATDSTKLPLAGGTVTGNLYANGSFLNVGGYMDISGAIYLRGSMYYLNAAGTAWNNFAIRNGEGFNMYATAYYENSDIRYKNVIETNPQLSGLGIDVIKFTRKDSDVVRYGYSAQQVQAVIPEAVEGADNLVVNYIDVHTIKIASLERRVAELEAKLKSTL